MTVTNHAVASNTFTVTRGAHLAGGIAVPAHNGSIVTGGATPPATVYEVLTTTLNGAIAAASTSTLQTGIDSATATVTTSSVIPGLVDGTSVILIDGEQMQVTAGSGTTSLTVTRGFAGTPVGHGATATVTKMDDTISVTDVTSFTTTNSPYIRIDNEDMRVLSVGANTFNVLRAANGTASTAHSN